MSIDVLESSDHLKDIFKDAMIEVLEERHDLFAEIVAEALADLALARAIQEGEESADVSREEVFRLIDMP